MKLITTCILFVNLFLLSACHSQTKNNIGSNEIDMKELAVYNQVLTDNNYTLPTVEEFRSRLIKYLGIDIDTISDNSFVVGEEFTFYKKERLMTTSPESVYYQPEREKETEGVNETADYIMARNDGKQFLAFNQLFFKDDTKAIPYFNDDFNGAANIVVYFNYEENKDLLKNTIRSISLDGRDLNLEVLKHLLFYNNRSRGFRKEVIDILYKRDESLNSADFMDGDFSRLQDLFLSNYYKIDIPIEIVDSCYIYIAQKLNDHDKKVEDEKWRIDQNQGYTAISGMGFLYGLDFFDRLKAKNYYNDPKIKESVESYIVLKDYLTPQDEINKESYILKARIEDKDGYVNLRKSASLSSDIIGRIKSGTIVTVDDDNDNSMRLISTEDGIKGYVHNSRLNAYYQGRYSNSL